MLNFRAERCNRVSRGAGFTLIELTIIIVIIGVLAAAAIPRYLDLTNEAKLNATKGILGNMRAAIMMQRVDNIIKTGQDRFPSLADIQDNPFQTGCTVLETGDLPDNPFSTGSDPDGVVSTTGRPVPTGTDGAWAYDPRTGGFYANTKSGNGEELF
ncbi:MAG: hypothetical protein COV74_02715 [Candidatus Omnitrophica bacterium CG11_big_fil_rev_8_21_14_0_20_45_26]|uniref:General secretion pathway protein GspG n=1 Tax=Candidatus Abzuiibacterium crystallinum TaxID=1974748 RepID=A0A2H0LTF5_9BACT|nr:MAG: hypothetical protein COV74_02715 [Candidatus Omnitrophica bacterium CG11_big_fil_rev_8_21_14_0_20_45_26]PIW65566.1 MAG: hypothetical protein COW12_01205 [Candidatus Omnitrophica bacterium CG12_big_fil_rev_8_21_14_0_65_45_16]